MNETSRSRNMRDAGAPCGRKLEFVMTALELFYRKGYDNTTINDIVDEMGLSKGAFYHYFESKDDVIVSIARVFTDKAVSIVRSILDRTDLSALEKMNAAIISINELKFSERQRRSKFKAVIGNAQNLKLQDRVIRSIRQDIVPLVRELIDAGVEEDVFGDPVDSLELADFFLNTIHSLNTAVDQLENELCDEADPLDRQEFQVRLEQKVRFYQVLLERIFQLRDGTVDLYTPYLMRLGKAE